MRERTNGTSVTLSTHTLLSRKVKNQQLKTLLARVKEIKRESLAAPINFYKKQQFYKEESLKDRRKYNATSRYVEKHFGNRHKTPEQSSYSRFFGVDPEKVRFLMHKETMPMGTSLNKVPDVSLDNYPDSTKEEIFHSAFNQRIKQPSKTDKRITRKKPTKPNRKKA